MDLGRISFSGPAKRDVELQRTLSAGVGELVLENLGETTRLSAFAVAAGKVQKVLVRINPRRVPRGFGASMAATPSQFGIDEEDIATALPLIRDVPGLHLAGLHLAGFQIYSGTNCRDAAVIAENFGIFAGIFRQAEAITGIKPEALVFGSGFGVPYLPGEVPLDHAALPALIHPVIDALHAEPAFAKARCTLDLGRWLVGPAGVAVDRGDQRCGSVPDRTDGNRGTTGRGAGRVGLCRDFHRRPAPRSARLAPSGNGTDDGPTGALIRRFRNSRGWNAEPFPP